MRRFDHVIFDVDGVLLDTMPIWEDSANLYLREVWNIDAPDQVDRDCMSMSLLEAAAYMKRLYPQLSVPDRVLADGVAEFIRERYWNANAKPYMQETVRRLHGAGIALYLATASETKNVQGALTNLGVWKCFSGIFTCTDVGYSKSYPAFYEEVSRRIGVPCEALLMVEDSLHSMRTAKAAGLTVVGVYDEASVENTQEIIQVCDTYMQTLQTLPDWIGI